MRRLLPIVPALALMTTLTGCYTEESPSPTAANTSETTPTAPEGAAGTGAEPAARPAGSTLGAAKRTAQSTVNRVQDQSANLAKEIEDPE